MDSKVDSKASFVPVLFCNSPVLTQQLVTEGGENILLEEAGPSELSELLTSVLTKFDMSETDEDTNVVPPY